MKHIFIVANWKSNKNEQDVREWFEQIASSQFPTNDKTVILCPSFPLLPLCRELIQKHHLPWQLGAQDVSAFGQGRHTGEVNAVQLKDFAEYILVGHSERRQQLGETDDVLVKKVQQTRNALLQPLFFAQTIDTKIPVGVEIVAYEPPGAISPSPADNPGNVEKAAIRLKQNKQIRYVLYGGNVTPDNAKLFMTLPHIDGVIVGNASLDALLFTELIQYA